MIRFSLFGIPIEIQPFFWLVCAFLGGVISADTAGALFEVVLFMVAAFISVLIHELGHAVVGRRLGGGYASIVLTSFGGLAFNHGGRFDRQQRFWMIAAGPGAGFAFLLIILAGLSLFFGSTNAAALAGRSLFGLKLAFDSPEVLDFFRSQPYSFLYNLMWINLWWGVVNLLPVLPLDGGQIAELYIRPQRRTFLVGMITAGLMALFGYFQMGSIYVAVLFGYLCWKNYQNMKSLSWQ